MCKSVCNYVCVWNESPFIRLYGGLVSLLLNSLFNEIILNTVLQMLIIGFSRALEAISLDHNS